jgi:RecJ-like exonuclease
MCQQLVQLVRDRISDMERETEEADRRAKEIQERANEVPAWRPCPVCGGSGRAGLFLSCSECHGRGIVYNEQSNDLAISSWYYSDIIFQNRFHRIPKLRALLNLLEASSDEQKKILEKWGRQEQ